MPPPEIAIRPACPADIPALRAMHGRSLKVLGAAFYRLEEIAAFLEKVGTFDPALIEDGTYWVAEHDGELLASGGWSVRAPGYAEHARAGAAGMAPMPKIRSIFVAPELRRMGLGRRITAVAEQDAAAQGFRAVELVATLMGVPFYRALGYRACKPYELDLGDGLRFCGLAMAKTLAAPGCLAA